MELTDVVVNGGPTWALLFLLIQEIKGLGTKFDTLKDALVKKVV